MIISLLFKPIPDVERCPTSGRLHLLPGALVGERGVADERRGAAVQLAVRLRHHGRRGDGRGRRGVGQRPRDGLRDRRYGCPVSEKRLEADVWCVDVVVSSRNDDKLVRGNHSEINFTVEETTAGVSVLEHVEVIFNVKYPVRGALEVALVSPSGTCPQDIKGEKL